MHIEILTPPGLYGGGYGAAAKSSTFENATYDADGYNSPGWKRLQAQSAGVSLAQPKNQAQMTLNATATSSHTVGDRVFHQKFGYGVISGIEGDKLEIEFDKAGLKKVVARFVRSPDDISF